MGNLVDALLGLSQVIRTPMRWMPVDLGAIVWEIAVELQSEVEGRMVLFEIAEDRVVEGMSRLLRIMLENLIGNAWKFTPEPSPGPD